MKLVKGRCSKFVPKYLPAHLHEILSRDRHPALKFISSISLDSSLEIRLKNKTNFKSYGEQKMSVVDISLDEGPELARRKPS